MRPKPAFAQRRKRPSNVQDDQIDVIRVPQTSVFLRGVTAGDEVGDLGIE
jgi:hypothetical protein